MKELEKIDTALEKVNDTDSSTKNNSNVTPDLKKDGGEEGRLDKSLDEIVNRVVQQVCVVSVS